MVCHRPMRRAHGSEVDVEARDLDRAVDESATTGASGSISRPRDARLIAYSDPSASVAAPRKLGRRNAAAMAPLATAINPTAIAAATRSDGVRTRTATAGTDMAPADTSTLLMRASCPCDDANVQADR